MATTKKTAKTTVAKKTPVKKAATKKAASKSTSKDVCFTIMPFGGWFDDYYAGIYKPAIEDAGMDPKRADDMYRPSTIVNDIWDYTQRAKIVLADLTNKNPNVFYELGLAHALAKPAILITESMDDVPFDLRALRVIEYDKNRPNWGDSLKCDITESIKEINASPLESVLPAFLKVKPDGHKKELTEAEKEILSMKQDLDMLRHEVLRGRNMRIRDIDPDEAEALIRTYLERGVPTEIIARRLRDRGAPVSWVNDKISKLRR